MNSGVYTITQHSTGKRYVGSSVNLQNRKDSHYSGLRRNTHGNSLLQRAFMKYGEADFDFRVLLHCDVNQVLFYEQRALDILTPEFNILRVAGNSTGRLATPETRAKMSMSQKGRTCSPETRTKMSAAGKGRTFSSETRAKISASNKGRIRSPEVRAKMSAYHTGRTRSLEARANMSASAKGRTFSTETRAKMSAAQKGRPVSPETRAKLSEAQKKRYAAAC